MRRIALILATAGVIAFGIAGVPAQAHEGWGYGQQQWSQHRWRGHEPPLHVTIIRGSQVYN